MLSERTKVRRATTITEVVDIMEWKVGAARDTAWTHAEVLWALQTSPALRDAFFARLDHFTGFAGRGLLVRPAQLQRSRNL